MKASLYVVMELSVVITSVDTHLSASMDSKKRLALKVLFVLL